MSRLPALLAGALTVWTVAAEAAPPAGPVVVELFTSQGCNSCPPADALLGELARGPDVLALTFHVTYWNYLGWKDGFSQTQFDQRQSRYVHQLGLGSSYTPQMVVNGSQDVVGSERGAVLRAVKDAWRPAAITLQQNGDALQLSLPALDHPQNTELTLFGLRASASTPVGRGENSGHTLNEYRIVRAVQSLGTWNGTARVLSVRRAAMPADVTAYAVLAQERGTGRVVAAGQ